MNKITFFSAIVSVVVLAACTGNETGQEITATTSFESYSEENCSRSEEIKSNSKDHPDLNLFDTLCTKIKLELVKIETPSQEISQKINREIEAEICRNYSFGEENYTTIEEILNSVNEDENGFDVSIHTNVITNTNNVLCVQLNFDTYSFGAAHPFAFSYFMNFDLGTGKTITLDELMQPGYKSRLNEIGKKNFIQQNGKEGWNFSRENEFQLSDDFAITEKGLLFSYNPYDIGPYVMGAPDVLIKYEEISSLIKKGGLLKKFAQ